MSGARYLGGGPPRGGEPPAGLVGWLHANAVPVDLVFGRRRAYPLIVDNELAVLTFATDDADREFADFPLPLPLPRRVLAELAEQGTLLCADTGHRRAPNSLVECGLQVTAAGEHTTAAAP